MTARTFSSIISVERIKLWAAGTDNTDGRVLLARLVLDALEKDGSEAAEAVFLSKLEAYFYNVTATKKRQYADSLSVAFTDNDDAADDLFELMKDRK